MKTPEPSSILVRHEALPGRLPLAGAIDEARARLAALTRRREDAPRSPWILRLLARIEPVDVLDWLSAQRETPRWYWQSRGGAEEVAAAGALVTRESSSLGALAARPLHVRGSVPEGFPEPRLAITARFQDVASMDPAWRVFGRVRTWLPRVEIRRTGNEHMFAFCFDPNEPRGLDRAFASVSRAQTDDLPEIAVRALEEGPPPEWGARVGSALAPIERGALEKIVLAHRFRSEPPPHGTPLAFVRALRETHADAFVFAVLPTAQDAFFGASPELLFRRSGRAIASEALAGTRPRGMGDADDRRLANELLASEKDRAEHQIVVTHLERELAPVCERLTASETRVHAFSSVQHLSTRFHGTLLPGVSDGAVLSRLHPTPAVCGSPTEAARARIAEIEGFDRGLYGGVVGWLGEGETECAVAIRCARLGAGDFSIYAGVGIVAGSSATEEWEEITTKLATFQCLQRNPAP